MSSDRATIDTSRLQADLRAARVSVEQATNRLQQAQVELERAQSELFMLEQFAQRMDLYSISDDDEGEAAEETDATLGPLEGLQGSTATLKFVGMYSGKTMKLGEIYRQMRSLGFKGTENAVSVAMGNLVAGGVVQRGKKRGYYVLTPTVAETFMVNDDGSTRLGVLPDLEGSRDD